MGITLIHGSRAAGAATVIAVQLLAILLETTAEGRWRPGIGDASPLGWLTVAAYLAGSGLCWAASRRARRTARTVARLAPVEAGNQRALAAFWLAGCGLLFLLGVNKQLDLQSLFTQLTRDLALAQGWYAERRRYQVAFVAGLAGAGALAGALAAWRLRRILGRVAGPLLGATVLCVFVVVRAASFHHVDLALHGGPVPLNATLELGGILVIAAFAGRAAGLWGSP